MTLISITLLKAQLSDQEQLGMNRAGKVINIIAVPSLALVTFNKVLSGMALSAT